MCATRTGRSGISRAPTAIAVAASWEPSNPTRRKPPSAEREASASLRSAGSSAACGADITTIILLHRPTAEVRARRFWSLSSYGTSLGSETKLALPRNTNWTKPARAITTGRKIPARFMSQAPRG